MCDDYKEEKYSLDIDEWPPDQPSTVVNVALIHYKGSRTEQELIEISKRHKEGAPAIDELVKHSKVTKNISKIFLAGSANSPDDSGTKPPKFILIEGAPGIGKTVLAKKIAHCWAKKELLTNVKVLFLLFLRDPELHNITTPVELIQYMSGSCFNDEEAENCVQQIRKLQVGLVMDGFDECPIELRKSSFIAKLLKGRVFKNAIVVLTSRPTATIMLHNKVDRRVEILGFAQEERDQYINKSLDSPDKRKQLQDYLRSQPIINSLVYVPLHLAILLYLFKVQSKLPKTLTEMNESFILHTIYRSLAKNDLTPVGPHTVVSKIKYLSKNVLDIVKGLSKLAFIGLQNSKLVFSYDEVMASCPEVENNVPGALSGFGLLQVVQHFPKKSPGTTVSFNFLHFTMQEFLAAFHISNITINLREQQLSLMETTFWDGKYTFMWMMFVGINGINSETFLQFLYKAEPEANIKTLKLSESITSDKIKCLHLFQCFMEAKSEQFPKEISKIFYNNEINFCALQLLPQHISSITLYVSKCSIQLQTLNLRDCHIGDVGMSILLQYFTSNPDAASSINHLDLFGNNSVLLWNVYCAVFGQQNLKKLDWSSLGGINVEEVVNIMDSNMLVQSLDISNNHFKNDDAEKIAEVLKSNAVLQELDISNNNFTTRGAIAISQSLCNKIEFQYLKMSWNNYFLDTDQSMITFSHSNMKNGEARILGNVLCSNKSVTELNLSRNKISDNSAKDISNCIEINKSLKEVDLSRNRISDIGLKQIAVALQKNQVLQKLNISHNNISDDGAIAVSDSLKKNNTLVQLNMSQNKISKIGIISIGKVLQTNTTLQQLDISYNQVCNDGVVAFCDHLKKRNRFQKLRISWNDGMYLELDFTVQSSKVYKMNMGNTGVILVSSLLYINASLQALDVSNNNISDDGVVAIGEGLKRNIALLELNLSVNEISDDGVLAISEALKDNNTLQELNLSVNKITDDGAVAISEALKDNIVLHKLDMSANEITDVGIVAILNNINFKCPLHTLNLTCNIVSKSMLVINDIYEKVKYIPLFQISYNEMVDMQFQIITINTVFVDFKEFNQFTINRKIKLDMQDKSARYIVKVLCCCAKNNHLVKELNLSHLDITNDEAQIVAKALQTNMILQTLNISHNNISDDGAVAISESLKSNNTLKGLNMSYNKVSYNGIISFGKALQINATLQILDLSCNNISDDELLTFSNLLKEKNTLHELIISWNSDVVYLDFTVTRFNLDQNQCGNSGVNFVVPFLHHNTIVEELDLSYNKVSDDGAAAIYEYLKKNNTLQNLNVSYSNISNNGIIIICEALKMNQTLHKIDISHNNISDDGAEVISECLMNNSTLQEINISYNKIFRSGIGNIGRAVKILNISHNIISDSGAVAIGECLKQNYSLQHLDISYNQISNIGITIIGKALQINKTLQKLNISHNNISDDGATSIGKSLRNHYVGNTIISRRKSIILIAN